jgi:sec-independent protein translocase protein TatB
MFDIGWYEILVLVGVGFLVVGPKDLPRAMLVLGRLAGKVRRTVQSIQHDLTCLAHEAEVAERLKEESQAGEKKDNE